MLLRVLLPQFQQSTAHRCLALHVSPLRKQAICGIRWPATAQPVVSGAGAGAEDRPGAALSLGVKGAAAAGGAAVKLATVTGRRTGLNLTVYAVFSDLLGRREDIIKPHKQSPLTSNCCTSSSPSFHKAASRSSLLLLQTSPLGTFPAWCSSFAAAAASTFVPCVRCVPSHITQQQQLFYTQRQQQPEHQHPQHQVQLPQSQPRQQEFDLQQLHGDTCVRGYISAEIVEENDPEALRKKQQQAEQHRIAQEEEYLRAEAAGFTKRVLFLQNLHHMRSPYLRCVKDLSNSMLVPPAAAATLQLQLQQQKGGVLLRADKKHHGDTVWLLLLNLGSPAQPTYADVWQFLAQFLSDRRVIETSRLLWQFILRVFILPTRSYPTSRLYQRIWHMGCNDNDDAIHSPSSGSNGNSSSSGSSSSNGSSRSSEGSLNIHGTLVERTSGLKAAVVRGEQEVSEHQKEEEQRVSLRGGAEWGEAPLIRYTRRLARKLQHRFDVLFRVDQKGQQQQQQPLVPDLLELPEKDERARTGEVRVILGMRYGTPSVEEALEVAKEHGCRKLFVFPLYPQTVAATTSSAYDAVFQSLQSWRVMPDLRLLSGYADHPAYIKALAFSIRRFWKKHKHRSEAATAAPDRGDVILASVPSSADTSVEPPGVTKNAEAGTTAAAARGPAKAAPLAGLQKLGEGSEHLLQSTEGGSAADVREADVTGSDAEQSGLPHRVQKLIFSYHGIPNATGRQAAELYQCLCLKTTRLVAEELKLKPGEYEIAYQSRFGTTPWVKPYLEPRLEALAVSGCKRVDIVAPGFAVDCLETFEEVGVSLRERWRLWTNGRGDLRAIPCLNASDEATTAIFDISKEQMIDWLYRRELVDS